MLLLLLLLDTVQVCKGFRACACFSSVAFITCALRAQGLQLDPGQKHAFGVLFTENEKRNIQQRTEFILHHASFGSVVVITCASQAQGHQFEPGRKQTNMLRSQAVYYQILNRVHDRL